MCGDSQSSAAPRRRACASTARKSAFSRRVLLTGSRSRSRAAGALPALDAAAPSTLAVAARRRAAPLRQRDRRCARMARPSSSSGSPRQWRTGRSSSAARRCSCGPADAANAAPDHASTSERVAAPSSRRHGGVPCHCSSRSASAAEAAAAVCSRSGSATTSAGPPVSRQSGGSGGSITASNGPNSPTRRMNRIYSREMSRKRPPPTLADVQGDIALRWFRTLRAAAIRWCKRVVNDGGPGAWQHVVAN